MVVFGRAADILSMALFCECKVYQNKFVAYQGTGVSDDIFTRRTKDLVRVPVALYYSCVCHSSNSMSDACDL